LLIDMTYQAHPVHPHHPTHLPHHTHLPHQPHHNKSKYELIKGELGELKGQKGDKDYFIDLLLKEDPDLFGRMENRVWKPLSTLSFPEHRTLCANELVFDLDGKNWESAHPLAEKLEKVFFEWKIPFFRYSSGNFLHYHVYFAKDIQVSEKIWMDYFSHKGKIGIGNLTRFLKLLRFAIFEYLTNLVNSVKDAHFDMALMKASRHMVRMEGSKNEKTGYYKSLLLELPEDQPKIQQQDVILPSKIEHWEIPENLLFYVYRFGIEKPKPSIPRTFDGKEIKWIEKLLKTPMPEGRHRIVDLILSPYLIHFKGLDVETAFGIIWDWIEKSRELNYTRINRSYVLNKLRSVKRRNLKFLSKKNVDKWFSDVPEILEVID